MHLLTTCTMGFEGISGQDPLGNLGEMQVLVQLGWVGPGGSAFLARSQMVLTLLVCVSDLKKQGAKPLASCCLSNASYF